MSILVLLNALRECFVDDYAYLLELRLRALWIIAAVDVCYSASIL